MGKKGGGLLHQAQKAAKQQHKQQKWGGLTPAAKRHKTASGQTAQHIKQKPQQQQAQKKNPPQPRQHTEPTIPFSPHQSILLIGEGDLSFAASLAVHHKCTNLTATVLEKTPDELLAKYPHAQSNISQLCPPDAPKASNNKLLYNIDARKFAAFTKSKSSAAGAMDRIIFNFPHVGGKSTDVNRQVRYNQEMLVDFFRRAVPSLAPHGSIVVTLFEGEPYTLWNIRDLARHSGLQVERSFRFQARAYPGYRHARTLGVLRKKGGSNEGEVSEGGWRGEDRAARSYVFVRKGEGSNAGIGEGEGSRKRKKGEDEDSDGDVGSSEEGVYGDEEEDYEGETDDVGGGGNNEKDGSEGEGAKESDESGGND